MNTLYRRTIQSHFMSVTTAAFTVFLHVFIGKAIYILLTIIFFILLLFHFADDIEYVASKVHPENIRNARTQNAGEREEKRETDIVKKEFLY